MQELSHENALSYGESAKNRKYFYNKWYNPCKMPLTVAQSCKIAQKDMLCCWVWPGIAPGGRCVQR